MVKEGNIRLDISIPKSICTAFKKVLIENGKMKKGSISNAISEALELWIKKNKIGCSGCGSSRPCGDK